jgi:hypothetical protein
LAIAAFSSNSSPHPTNNSVNGGTASGSGIYPVGTDAKISAIANSGWVFTGWNDGSTNNPYMVTVPVEGLAYMANFACAYELSITSTNFLVAGGNGNFSVTTGGGCDWVAISEMSWLHTESVATGSGVVNYTVDANSNITARSGVITIQGTEFTVTQDANILAIVGNIPVVAKGDTVIFTTDPFDTGGQSISNLWDFGDNEFSTNASQPHAFSTCGPHTVSLTMYTLGGTVSTSFVVSVACPFEDLPKLVTLKMKSNFVPGKFDRASLKGVLNLPLGVTMTNFAAQLSIGSLDVPFTLDSKGKGMNGYSSVKFSRRGKPVGSNQLWQVSAKFKGDFDALWAEDGLANTNVLNQPLTVPVLLLLDTDPPESFYIEKPVLYKATQGKSGSAK